jgi:hypothetical protein
MAAPPKVLAVLDSTLRLTRQAVKRFTDLLRRSAAAKGSALELHPDPGFA